MNNIQLNSIKEIDFAKELKQKFLETKITKQLNITLNNASCQNFDILIYYAKKKQIKNIIFEKDKNTIDILCQKKFTKLIKKYYLVYSKDIKITFENFSHKEILNMLGERNYLNYCNINQIKPIWDPIPFQKELQKIKEHKELLKYQTFKILVNKQKFIPFSMFNFPKENKTDRFVFYFNIESEQRQKEILNLIKALNIQKYTKIIELIKTNKINDEIYYYALGFSYQKNKLIRLTLYTKFDTKLLINEKLTKQFLKEKHNLELEEPFKNLWYYAIDFYEKHEEIKLYDEPYYFNIELKDETLNSILKNKICVRVLKYKNNQKYNEKFEFEFDKCFNKNEKETLQKYKLYDKKSKILAIYVQEGKIIKKVLYNL